jgi:hypothetical protein
MERRQMMATSSGSLIEIEDANGRFHGTKSLCHQAKATEQEQQTKRSISSHNGQVAPTRCRRREEIRQVAAPARAQEQLQLQSALSPPTL